jgi:serine protease Do
MTQRTSSSFDVHRTGKRTAFVPGGVLAACLIVGWAPAASAQRLDRTDPLLNASASIETLVRRVSHSVVQIKVTGYRPISSDTIQTAAAVGRGQSIASGVVVASDGYILTNAHVVAGAERIEVVLPALDDDDGPARLGGAAPRIVEARLVGVAGDLDLALLSIAVSGLPALAIADYESVRQGELVFAFGSPDGLGNSVSMGMVSAVARQTEPDNPLVYIQTDAAINPGNSGGPLVNVKGELIGINTFIRSASGGSEGLGFALPSTLVALAYAQLREYGHLHRARIGLVTQTVTPLLATGLGLPPDASLVAEDVLPGSPAALAGLQPGDVIVAINGQPVQRVTVARLYLSLYTLRGGQELGLSVLRGSEVVKVTVTAVETPHDGERPTLIDTTDTLIESLGIVGLAVDESLRSDLPELRAPSGVLVAARVQTPKAPDGLLDNLEKGDVIHAVNGKTVATPMELRDAIAKVEKRGAIVLQVERNGRLSYVAFEQE